MVVAIGAVSVVALLAVAVATFGLDIAALVALVLAVAALLAALVVVPAPPAPRPLRPVDPRSVPKRSRSREQVEANDPPADLPSRSADEVTGTAYVPGGHTDTGPALVLPTAVSSRPRLDPHLVADRPHGQRVPQCPACGGLRVTDTSSEFRCRREDCRHRWPWTPGTPWPATTVLPPSRTPTTSTAPTTPTDAGTPEAGPTPRRTSDV